ncbi:Eco57I restriction-modification methylase domain-containing protein [Haloferax chudinovii]|uniref:Eco57I restriction-modification methylase domain-containing protein n=1 Tax=Haloferax chudinovii TaxID=1109010 RepID=UPI003A9481B0
MYGLASAVLEAKQWDADFTKRFNERRSYRDASHQIKYYLERTPDSVQWGILTDGRKWRLYGTKDYETETFYEVDLPEILESGNLARFKYFYLFFRPAAFHETSGTTFLDRVWNESETAAQELGEDLQDNVFTALRVLGKGFVETNNLDIDPDDTIARNELKEQSLVLLYRLMFILYAESRHLIDPDDADRKQEYEENFSLDQLRLDILDTVGEVGSSKTFDDSYSEFSTSMWSRLQNLFSLIDAGQESLGIPPYNGGLFDEESHEFLADNDVADRYLAEVIYRLSTTETADGFVPADYADLDTRHLGTIYEGLLEHEFRIAPTQYAAVTEDGGQIWKDAAEVSVAESVETVEAGGLYVVNDDGERKATGAYYTPDYVVTYIVEETVDPLIEDIDDTLEESGLERGSQEYVFRFADEVLSLKVLDPAMGSGHFLTKATGYLAEQVMERVREVEEAAGVFDEQDIRRRVSRECIYGVDLNGMAVELAKLSMWLETLAADQPLAFLDHHLKAGNSLVGSDITEVLTDDTEENGGQLTLTQSFARVRQHTLEHVMELFQELLAIDNETLDDIKSMEELYGEIRDDPLYHRLFELANVHTAEQFGLDVPPGVYETMAGAVEDEAEWEEVAEKPWFAEAQAMASREQFFHWELEFPEVFFGDDGEMAEDAGFDAVVGNPPWLGTRTGIMAEGLVEYLREEYISATGQFDLAAVFLDQGVSLVSSDQSVGFVVPKRIATNESYEDLRRGLTIDRNILSAIDLGVAFEGVNNDALVIIIGQTDNDESVFGERVDRTQFKLWSVPSDISKLLPFNIIPVNSSSSEIDVVKKVTNSGTSLGRSVSIERGAECGMNHESISNEPTESSLPIVDHLDVGPYAVNYSGQQIDTNRIDDSVLKSIDIYKTVPKLLVRFLAPDLRVAIDDTGYVSTNLVYHVQCDGHVEFLSGLLSSKLLNFWYFNAFQNDEVKFPHVQKSHIESLPVPELPATTDTAADQTDIETCLSFVRSNTKIGSVPVSKISSNIESAHGVISHMADHAVSFHESRNDLNLSLLDYLGNYSDGDTLGEIGFQQPAQSSADSILHDTTEDKTKLGITDVVFERENPTSLTVSVGVRYKPDNPEEYETDQYDYHYVDPQPAFRITDLTETEADLIEAFVPVAVDEAGGFANFRTNATKTNSPLDRLEKLTLPAVDDVRDGLAQYLETKERADELEEKIERTDELIDEIVYELYGLTDEEIAIVEESVGN